MIKYEDECVGCPPEMGCLHGACKYSNVPRFYCDECGDEVDDGDLYHFDGAQLCLECIVEKLERVREGD